MLPVLIKMVDFKNLAWATSFDTCASRKFIYLPYMQSGKTKKLLSYPMKGSKSKTVSTRFADSFWVILLILFALLLSIERWVPGNRTHTEWMGHSNFYTLNTTVWFFLIQSLFLSNRLLQSLTIFHFCNIQRSCWKFHFWSWILSESSLQGHIKQIKSELATKSNFSHICLFHLFSVPVLLWH